MLIEIVQAAGAAFVGFIIGWAGRGLLDHRYEVTHDRPRSPG